MMSQGNDSLRGERKKIYLNDAQYYLLSVAARNLVAICGRGIGKGVIQASRLLQFVQAMPRCSMGFVVPSVKRGLTNILPSIMMHLNNWGYRKDIHYCIGHRPAKSWHWREPIWQPESYDNIISFYNGSYVTLISQDRVGTSNSMSLDGLLIDEAKFINFERLKDETFQANRGNEMYFGKCYLHHGMTVTSDMPVTKAGSWPLAYEKQMDKEVLEVVEGLVFQFGNSSRPFSSIPTGPSITGIRLHACRLSQTASGGISHSIRSIRHWRISPYSVSGSSMT